MVEKSSKQTLIHRIRFCWTVRESLCPRQRFGVQRFAWYDTVDDIPPLKDRSIVAVACQANFSGPRWSASLSQQVNSAQIGCCSDISLYLSKFCIVRCNDYI